jgi:hypothetical protein
MKIRPNRKTERLAINASRTLFEEHNHVFQEIDLGNDFGKDVYVDIAQGQNVTGLCIALQVKGGVSYRRPGGYGIPLNNAHAEIWMQSSIPIAGIVFDPKDGLLRWCNISEFLNSTPRPLPSYIPVESTRLLTPETLETDFIPSYAGFHTQRVVGPAMLCLTSDDCSTQQSGLRDCFILGRSDARVLIMIRRLLSWYSKESLRLAVAILAHATPHPDIIYHPKNIVPHTVCQILRPHFHWTSAELFLLMTSVDWEEWHRGGQGQCVYSLICDDPAIEQKIADLALTALNIGNDDLAFSAMYLAIYWARQEARQMYDRFIAIDSRFGELPLATELRSVLDYHDAVTLFE